MPIRNSTNAYGSVSITLHWIMAIAIIGLYFVGDYMVGLDYYNSLYHTLPNWHKSIGILTAMVLVLRLAWLHSHPRPEAAASTAPAFTHVLAKLGHWALYLLLIVIIISGYLISTAEAKGISVFSWFEIPALLGKNSARGDLAGKVHEIAATILMLMVIVHVAAALIHHFYWKDNTLKRMFGSH